MEALLYTSLLLLAYTYAGYPLLAGALAALLRRPHWREPIEPTVSLVILAYNEERDIARKLENALALDYPREKLEIVVASDGSTDRTDEIVRGFADRGVRLFRAREHPGKSGTTNRVAETTTGDYLSPRNVFSGKPSSRMAASLRRRGRRRRVCTECGRKETIRSDNPSTRCRSCAARRSGRKGIEARRAARLQIVCIQCGKVIFTTPSADPEIAIATEHACIRVSASSESARTAGVGLK